MAKRRQTTSERLDAELAAAALRKRQSGQKPTREEMRALRRVETARDQELRAEHYASVPKKTWREWSGHLPYKTLDDLADKFGIPTRGKTIDLAEVIRWVYGLLRTIKPTPGGEPEEPNALERLREIELKRREMLLAKEAGEMIPAAEIERGFSIIASIFRRATETLQLEHGPEAARIISNAWDDVRAKIDLHFAVDVQDEE